MTVLVIEDDRSMSCVMQLGLERAGHQVLAVDTGAAGIAAFDEIEPSCVLLDLSLPGISGRDILRGLRGSGNDVPIIVVTGYEDKDSLIGCLNEGADDYITKPFSMAELSLRVEAVMRRSGADAEEVLRDGDLQVRPIASEATYAGHPIKLTGKEFALLELLMMRKGAVVTKEAMLRYLYSGKDEPEIKIIDVFICKLRRKLQAVAPGRTYIHTIWGRGFRFHGEIVQAP